MNRLYFGDNLKVLRQHIQDESIDLIYLDPPFNSNASYNVLFSEKTGKKSDAQIRAFEDTWEWDEAASQAYHEIVSYGGKPSAAIQAFHSLMGTSDMMAYLCMMGVRLIELHRVLKPTGSIYLHCDPTASHYLKMLMDAIFGTQAFRTEIVWKRSSAHSDAKQGRKQHGRIHDVILFYTKGDYWTWNQVFTPYDEDYIEAFYKYVEPDTSRRYRLGDLTGPGGAAKGNPQYEVMGVTRYWRYSREKMDELIRQGRIVQTKPGAVPQYKRYLDEMSGVPIQDMWTDINPIGAQAAERQGYPTQKPEALLERIIRASSNEGDTVLDPFCGCGTAVAVAQRLNRNWIGIDITYLAIDLIRRRLKKTFGDKAKFEVKGIPTNLAEAHKLAEEDRHQFEAWVCGSLDARIVGKKKGADRGIDGMLEFKTDESGKYYKVIISVKSGKPDIVQLRDLEGVITREKAALGVLVLLENPTAPMKKEAADSPYFESPWGRHHTVQILTVADMFAGKGIEYPKATGANVTFKDAPKAKGDGWDQPELSGEN